MYNKKPPFEITNEEYDKWRYNYPKSEAERNEEALQNLKVKKDE